MRKRSRLFSVQIIPGHPSDVERTLDNEGDYTRSAMAQYPWSSQAATVAFLHGTSGVRRNADVTHECNLRAPSIETAVGPAGLASISVKSWRTRPLRMQPHGARTAEDSGPQLICGFRSPVHRMINGPAQCWRF